MTVLGGDFTVISLLSVPMSTSPAQVATAVSSTFPDFTVAARQTSAVPKQPEPAKVLGLDLEGPDQSGIVKSLADILYKYNVSIKDLVTDTSSAPFIGYNIFALKSIIAVPFKTDFAAFEADLQQFEEKVRYLSSFSFRTSPKGSSYWHHEVLAATAIITSLYKGT